MLSLVKISRTSLRQMKGTIDLARLSAHSNAPATDFRMSISQEFCFLVDLFCQESYQVRWGFTSGVVPWVRNFKRYFKDVQTNAME